MWLLEKVYVKKEYVIRFKICMRTDIVDYRGAGQTKSPRFHWIIHKICMQKKINVLTERNFIILGKPHDYSGLYRFYEKMKSQTSRFPRHCINMNLIDMEQWT